MIYKPFITPTTEVMLSLVSGGKLSANKTAYKANKLTAATVHVEAVSTYISNNTTGICQPGNSINNLGAVTGPPLRGRI